MADKKDEDDDEKESSAEGGEEGGEHDEGAAAKKKKRKLIIIAAAAFLAIGVGGSAAYFTGMLSSAPKVEATTKKGKKKKVEGKEGGEEAPEHTTGSSVKAVKQNPNEWIPGVQAGHEGDDIAYYNLPEFLVNLDTSSKQTSFIKMRVTLQTPSDGENTDAIDSRLPIVIDKFNNYLRTLRITDVAGSAGLYRLRQALLQEVNIVINPHKVDDVLFQEIIIQ